MERLQLVTGRRRELVDITPQVALAVRRSGVENGLCHVFVPHTTAAVFINEGSDPAVGQDILNALEAMLPKIVFRHAEGNADAHILASLVGSSVTIPVTGGELALGTWQAVFFLELDGPRQREVNITFLLDHGPESKARR
ncbi:MAG: secondary thiamine-phosphate synthase enzyme YjbQ [Thermoanaerobaculaceae bacterium]